MIAAKRGNIEIVRLLLAYPETDLNINLASNEFRFLFNFFFLFRKLH